MRYFKIIVMLITSFPLFAQTEFCKEIWFEGEGTQYGGVAGSDGGNCGIPVADGDFYHCAMNHVQYDSSAACGACVRILGPKGEITLQVVDRCPECLHGDIDLSTEAFMQLAELKEGRIPIKWRYVPCQQYDDIKIYFEKGTSPYYFKAQFRNFKYAIKMVEYRKNDGSFVPIQREMYNYFVCLSGIDEDKSQCGPYTFKLTATSGESLLIENVIYKEGEEVSIGQQFHDAECRDCNGTIGGSAEIDNCGECTGGETGIEKNSTCQQDCIGYWNGSAFLDNCGICVGGTTGGTPCAETILTDIINGNDASIKKIEVYDLLGRTKKIITKEELKNLTHKNNNQPLILKIIKQTTIEVVKFYK